MKNFSIMIKIVTILQHDNI